MRGLGPGSLGWGASGGALLDLPQLLVGHVALGELELDEFRGEVARDPLQVEPWLGLGPGLGGFGLQEGPVAVVHHVHLVVRSAVVVPAVAGFASDIQLGSPGRGFSHRTAAPAAGSGGPWSRAG